VTLEPASYYCLDAGLDASATSEKRLMDTSEVRERVEQIEWFHSIDVGHGITTPGSDRSAEKLERLAFPESFAGLSVLDVGAWNGFFSFEAEHRGAERVLAVDSFCWSGDGWGTKDGFLLAHELRDSKVEDREMEVLDLSPDQVGQFDVVLWLGVLYHMKHPHLALERIASVTRNRLIMETHVDLLTTSDPAIAVYPGKEVNDDPTNWCGPNLPALEWMLRDVGFNRLERVYLTPTWKRVGRAAKRLLTFQRNPLAPLRQGRVVYHAWKDR